MASLIAAGSNAFQASGAKIFNMDAGTLSMASPAQIGRVLNGVTITAAMVAQNQAFLNAIAAYCRENGITVHVEAQLDNSPQADWTYQWLAPSVAAGLPITGVENDDEVEPAIAGTAVSYATRAAYEVNIVAQITAYYPTVQIGQWETAAPLDQTQAWWNAYDAAAAAAHLPGISYVIADTPWNAPWMYSQASWQAWQVGLSQMATSDNVSLTVLLDGIQAATSDFQWTAQAEQHAAMLAELPGMNVSTVLVRTWQRAYPDAVLPVNQPTTLANTAAEIAAVYPLYAGQAITATGTVSISAPPQVIVSRDINHPVGPVSLDWSGGSSDRVAVVIMDLTGQLSTQQVGGATVTGNGSTQLVLNGTYSDVSAELASLGVSESAAGPDTIDIEVFGANGRLADSQITAFSLPSYSAGSTQSFNFTPTTPTQGWTSANATMNASGTVTSEQLTWNAASYNATTDQYQIVQTISIHEPLAQADIVSVNGRFVSWNANHMASLPLGTNLVMGAFDPSQELSPLTVLSTFIQYDATTGSLQTEVDQIAPTPSSNIVNGTDSANFFATGGTRVTQFNTGSNPNWLPVWNAGLASVSTVLGSDGQLMEQVFQGGASEQYFTLDNVFDPYTGALWEQIESTPPPSAYDTFVTGSKYVTQFNTGDNPNWDYADWGSQAQVTVVWQDWKVVGVTLTPPVPTGLVVTDAYAPVASAPVASVPVASVPEAATGSPAPQIASPPIEHTGSDSTGNIYVDRTGTGGAIARLYEAAVARAPDLSGLIAYTSSVDANTISLTQAATGMVTSAEFIARYGMLSNMAFVDQLYHNAVGRAADAGGLAAYTAALNAGVSRGTVALDIGESFEARQYSISVAGYHNDATVYRMYLAILDRTPDASGEQAYSAALDAGQSVQDLAAAMLNSAEFKSDSIGMGNSEFISSLYHNLLNRDADPTGLQSYLSGMAAGASRAQVVAAFVNGSEAFQVTSQATHDGLVFTS
ncbi:MAG: DUF4214 domain-containing protein [Acetobacteraceae bacterium]|nr:DUF4214 domain-containing protein [Acetobacteraceae bacterium]